MHTMTYLSESALEHLVGIALTLMATMSSLLDLGNVEESGFQREVLAGSKHVSCVFNKHIANPFKREYDLFYSILFYFILFWSISVHCLILV